MNVVKMGENRWLGSVPEEEARKSLERVLAHREFQNSARMARFLRFVVERALEGDEGSLKETTIGRAVFDREADYDPKAVPIVRSEARRLRKKLETYYEELGAGDRVKIEIPKGGYAPMFHSAGEIVKAEGRSRGRWIWFGVAIVVVLALAVFGKRKEEEKVWEIRPLTSLPGREFGAAVSPDGKQVAYIWDGGNGEYDVYVEEAGNRKRLTATAETELRPAWSPDGKWLAFLRGSRDGVEVVGLELVSGKEKKLTEIRNFEWFGIASEPLHGTSDPGPAWTADGSGILLSDSAGGLLGSAIWRVEVATGSRVQLTVPPRLASDLMPAASPDGKRIAFVRQVSAASGDVYVAEIGGETRRLTKDSCDVRGLAWMPDGRELVVSSNRLGGRRLWRMSADGGEMKPLPVVGERILDVSVARNGTRMVYTSSKLQVNLWRYEIRDMKNPVRLHAASGENEFPRFSPDGKQLAWASDRSGDWQIWVGDAEGKEARMVTRLGKEFQGRLAGTPRWSPDGKRLAFDARPKDKCALYVLDLASGVVQRVSENEHEERNPAWSRDGKSLYFNSDREGKVQIWRVELASGKTQRISTRRAYDAAEWLDGSMVLFVPPVWEAGLYQANLDGTGEELVPDTGLYHCRRHWEVNASGLYFYGYERGVAKLLHWVPGKLRVLAEGDLGLIQGINPITVSPDGRWLVAAKPEVVSGDLMDVTGLR
jgi:Tol biopolymer transport system component